MTEVIMYTRSRFCPDSERARRVFRRCGVAYVEVYIDQDADAAAKVEAWNGGDRSVPTIDIDGIILTEPTERELEKALGEKGLL